MVAGEHIDAIGCLQRRTIKLKLAGQKRVEAQQPRRGNRGWFLVRKKAFGQARITIVEGK